MSYDFGASLSRSISSSSPSIAGYPSTLSAWVNLTSITTPSSFILTWSVWSSATSYFIVRMLVIGSRARTAVLGYEGGLSYVRTADTTTTLTTNTWHNITIVLLNSTSRTVYLNGSGSATSILTANITGMNNFRIGNSINQTNGAVIQTTAGKVSDVALWSTDLTTDEINSLSKGFSAKRIRPQSLEYYVPLTRDLIEYSNGLALTNNASTPVADNQRIYS